MGQPLSTHTLPAWSRTVGTPSSLMRYQLTVVKTAFLSGARATRTNWASAAEWKEGAPKDWCTSTVLVSQHVYVLSKRKVKHLWKSKVKSFFFFKCTSWMQRASSWKLKTNAGVQFWSVNRRSGRMFALKIFQLGRRESCVDNSAVLVATAVKDTEQTKSCKARLVGPSIEKYQVRLSEVWTKQQMTISFFFYKWKYLHIMLVCIDYL